MRRLVPLFCLAMLAVCPAPVPAHAYFCEWLDSLSGPKVRWRHGRSEGLVPDRQARRRHQGRSTKRLATRSEELRLFVTNNRGNILSELRKVTSELNGHGVLLRVNPEIARSLQGEEQSVLRDLERTVGRRIHIKADATLHHRQFDVMAV